MRSLRHRIVLVAGLFCGLAGGWIGTEAEESFFARLDCGWKPMEHPASPAPGKTAGRTLQPGTVQALIQSLKGSPDVVELDLPYPDGTTHPFRISPREIMAPELAQKFPGIKTFAGRSLRDPSVTACLDLSPLGLHAQILTPVGAVYLEPKTDHEAQVYSCYYRRDHGQAAEVFSCLTEAGAPRGPMYPLGRLGVARGGQELRTYRFAVAATGEFTQANGGTVASGLATIVSLVNRVSAIYEAELGIRLVLVGNNNAIVFPNPATDPYSRNDASTVTLAENQSTLDSLIGPQNYDVGHVLHTGAFGLANIGTVCTPGWKGRGCVGSNTPGWNATFAEFLAHELAHQFGANHTFNSMVDLCGGNRNAGTAYEPGSGSTLMSYAGFCSDDDLQDAQDPYFHSISYDEIMNFVLTGSGNNCPAVSSTGNTPPYVEAGSNFNIPRTTPFKLTASGGDADGDPVTYCWEERDLGPAQTVYDTDNGSSPLFRSHSPSRNPSRFFPRLSELVQNTRLRGELLPDTSRAIKFRVTARDGRGGIATSDMQLNVVATAGPFTVTSHNEGATASGPQLVRWTVAKTHLPPINVTQVRILLSTNGGLNFNTVLAANTPNDGSETVVLPAVTTSQARIQVQAVGNVFFDLNDHDFAIVPAGAIETDLNGDGHVDIILQHGDGRFARWLMNGTQFIDSKLLRDGKQLGAGWRTVGFGDFNADAKVDFLFQHNDGRMGSWLMNGAQFLQNVRLAAGRVAPPGWSAIGVADFNLDAHGDIVFFHHNDRRLFVWFMNGVNYAGESLMRNGRSLPIGWKAVGAGDFSGDGRADILLQHVDGRVALWRMQGMTYLDSVPLRDGQPASAGWPICGYGDFTGDGSNDLLLSNGSRQLQIWFMNGTAFQGSMLLRDGKSVAGGWTVVGPR